MECDGCKSEALLFGSQHIMPEGFEVEDAVCAVKENGVLLALCGRHMEEFYGLHETILVPGDTYVPHDED